VILPSFFKFCNFALYYSQVNAILPLVKGQIRKDQGRDACCTSKHGQEQQKKNKKKSAMRWEKTIVKKHPAKSRENKYLTTCAKPNWKFQLFIFVMSNVQTCCINLAERIKDAS